MRWFITKKHLVCLIGLLVAAMIVMALQGCIRIPVTVYPEFDAKGLPKALPVAPVGSQDLATGAFLPPFPVSEEPPAPAKDWWPMVEQGLTLALGLLVGGGGGAVIVRRAKAALQIACRLADEQTAVAQRAADESGSEQVKAEAVAMIEANKKAALALQVQAGVHTVTQKARGKA